MPTPQTTGNFNLQRSLWPQKKIVEHVISASPLMMALSKDNGFFEQYRYMDEGLDAGQGIGPAFSTAKANKGPDASAEFKYEVQTYYALFSIEGKLLRRAKGNSAVIVQPYARRSERAIKQVKRDLSKFLFGNGGGAFGRISSGSNVSTNTITLSNVDDVRFFNRGMYITASTADGTSGSIKAGRVKLAKAIKSGSNKGQLVCEELTWATGIGSVAASDYLFREGVFGNVWSGLAGHFPSTDPTATLFLNVDRSNNPDELAGLRVNATNKTPVNAMFEAALAVSNMYGQGDLYVCSATDWDNLRKDLANVTIIQVGAQGYGGKVVPGLEYTAIRTMGPKGKIDVLCDPDCPTGRSYMLTRETIKIASMGELLHLTADPMMEDQADAWESRFVTDSQIVVDGHGLNATVQLTSGA